MIKKLLVDTSAWIDHLKGLTDIVSLAANDVEVEIVTHSMVVIELALGGIPFDSETMANICELDQLQTVSQAELREGILKRGFGRKGIGYVDANLLLSCLLDDACLLSFDKKLVAMAADNGIAIFVQADK